MSHLPGFVIASAVAVLAAADVPFPVELTALAMVGLVLRFLLRRDARAHDKHDRRLTAVEKELRQQHTAKHAALNEITAMRAAIAIIVTQAQKCSCGTMEPLLPVLTRLSLETKETKP